MLGVEKAYLIIKCSLIIFHNHKKKQEKKIRTQQRMVCLMRQCLAAFKLLHSKSALQNKREPALAHFVKNGVSSRTDVLGEIKVGFLF